MKVDIEFFKQLILETQDQKEILSNSSNDIFDSKMVK